MVAITGDDLVAILQAGLYAGHDGFLSDIEVAETCDEEHVAVVFENFVFTRLSGCFF